MTYLRTPQEQEALHRMLNLCRDLRRSARNLNDIMPHAWKELGPWYPLEQDIREVEKRLTTLLRPNVNPRQAETPPPMAST